MAVLLAGLFQAEQLAVAGQCNRTDRRGRFDMEQEGQLFFSKQIFLVNLFDLVLVLQGL